MKIFIFGTGTIAEVAYSYLKNSKDFHIHGFVEFEKHLKSKKNLDYRLLNSKILKSPYHQVISKDLLLLDIKISTKKENMPLNY